MAPQAREQVSLVLDGHRMELVRTATAWVPRSDAPGLEVREQSDGTWVAFDGQGRSYLFAAVSSALSGTGLWLLQDVSGPGGSKVHLDYSIATPTVSGGVALSIDLVGVSYNPHPTTANCYKSSVTLSYDAPASSPLSVSMLGTTMLARLHKLTTVDVSSKESCGVTPVRLRRYQLNYDPDPDTRLPRLQGVTLRGREGTPEASTAITIAGYTYDTATNAGKLTYQPVDTGTISTLGHTRKDPSPPDIAFGPRILTNELLLDVTGDGRPDLLRSGGLNQMSVSRNKSSVDLVSFADAEGIPDDVLSGRDVEIHTTRDDHPVSNDMVWRQLIDVNGDGRVDMIDAIEHAGHWAIYLNTPDPTDPGKVRWVRRSYEIATLVGVLRSRGYTVDANYLPLARRLSLGESSNVTCWLFNGVEWVEEPMGLLQGFCEGYTGPLYNKTITDWELKDLNGDGYPDLVLNSSPIVRKLQPLVDERETQTSGYATLIQIHTLAPKAENNNKLQAVFNVLGVHIKDDTQPFSAPVTLRNNEPCGVAQSVGDGYSLRHLQCGIMDVNGDGIADRVDASAIRLGTGSLAPGSFFASTQILTLPGWLEMQQSNQWSTCTSGAPESTTFLTERTTGLRDLTGDGIPDYIVRLPEGWRVFVGTGTGFAPAIPIAGANFALSSTSADCGGVGSTVTDGLFDMDGDGRVDVVGADLDGTKHVYVLVGSDGTPGAPSAGRLVQTSNGFGADTRVRYRSVKADAGLHQVPFAEIVVDSVQTTGTQGFGGTLSATRYAYGGAELVFSPALDAFHFPGYRRHLVLQTPVAQPTGVATISITDMYAPVSAVDPYGIGAGSSPNTAQRYMQYQRVGRTRDTTVLSGNFGEAALTRPSLLLGIDVNTDSRRMAGAHYNWDARLLTSSSDPPGPEPCLEMVFPYDEASSKAFADGDASYDACTGRGFAFALSVQSWRGDPGYAPPSTANVETRSEIQTIDDFGRVLRAAQLNDLHRSDDDLCVDTTYATPTGSNERVLSAVSSRTVTNCASIIHAKDRFEYDRLAFGSVSSGFLSSHTVERRSDTGTLLGTVRTFDATFDALGNPASVTTTREDGATRNITSAFDPFGLALTSFTTAATSVPTTQVSITRDPVTLNATSTTDPNGTQHGATFDGFDREVLSLITPPGGPTGALSVMSYLGFTGSDSAGRRVVQKVFTDPVDPAGATTASGRTSTVYLDELGRQRRSEIALGADYANQVLIAGQRTYDPLGRVVFEADPYPSTQSFATAYGTTQFFHADGTLSCVVRGNGQQTTVPGATNEGQEIYPTCFERRYQDHTAVTSVRDPASFLTGSPQFGVKKSSYATAIGRLLSRSTWQGSARLEHATFSHDRLGHRTGMTRYQDAAAGSNPVTSSWHYDSLGQVLELDEPDSVPQRYTYSNWGELLEVQRTVPSTGTSKTVIKTYDALGRVMHSEQRSGGDVIAETVNDYFYDQGVNVASQVTPTNLLGRLALATSPTGSESFSYDAFGRINARVFTDNQGALYVEKHTFHGDGSADALDLFLPDTAYAREHVEYKHDSAGRGKLAKYSRGGDEQKLFEATAIDPFGRVRQASYGAATYTASYADIGRRLLNQVMVSSPSGSRAFTYQGYDPVGRERSRLEVKNGSTSGATTSWQYDALGRLSSAVQTSGATTAFNQQFTYDPLGNLATLANTAGSLGATTTALTYATADRDRICRIKYGTDTGTACNVTYDEVGSIVTQSTPTGQRQYSYFVDGSVRTITDSQGSTAQFRYDAFGAVQELELTSSVSPDVRHDRHYGGLISLRDEGGISVVLRKISTPEGSFATRHGAGGPWTFEFGEARGNRFFTDQNGAFVQDVDYQPYGKASSTGVEPGSTLYSNAQWNGGDALAAFGLSQLGARLYDPAIGRFLSRDPLLIPRTAATTNPYAFAMNDPVNRSDPSGLDSICNSIEHASQCVVIARDDLQQNPTGDLTWNIGTDWNLSSLGTPNYSVRRWISIIWTVDARIVA